MRECGKAKRFKRAIEIGGNENGKAERQDGCEKTGEKEKESEREKEDKEKGK